MRFLLFVFSFLFFGICVQAQTAKPIRWSFSLSKNEVKQGEVIEIIMKAEILVDWYLYSSDFDSDLGPTVSSIVFENNGSFKSVGKLIPIGAKEKYDSLWGGKVRYFTKHAEFRQKVKVLKINPAIKGNLIYQVCSDKEGKCIPYEEIVLFDKLTVIASAIIPEKTPTVATQKKKIDESELIDNVKNIDNVIIDTSTTAAITAISTNEPLKDRGNKESLGVYILTAIGLGLLALLMPCVFPIIPMTVTYFLKHSKSKRDGILKSLLYGLSIIIIYTSLAVIPALFLGEDFAIELSSNWVVNSLFFIVFILFGLSFLGMFEITLPASFVTKTDNLSEKGGFLGIFFMAFTLVLVSFSCTVPFVSGVIISLSGGSILKPIIGMLAYSTTFAIPFVLFAVFPTWLKSLPKSGSWMTVLKVILGFIEIGFAFKFLSAIDLSYGLDFFSRDLFISIWIVLAFVLGLYLLGKIILPHDDEVKRLGVPRLMAAIVTFTFGVYLIPGLFGAPLNFLSAILPPADYHTFNVKEIIREEVKNINHSNSDASASQPEVPLYGDILKLPHGINGYFDYDQAMRVAATLNKPVFIDFTGKNCGNCRKMENAVWSDPAVLAILKNDYLVVALYADTKNIDLPETENYIDRNGNKVTKLNKKNLDIEFKLGDVAQPYYVLLNPYTGEKLVQKSIGYEPNVKSFVQYLEEGKRNFKVYKK